MRKNSEFQVFSPNKKVCINRQLDIAPNSSIYSVTFEKLLYHPRILSLFAGGLGQPQNSFSSRNTFKARFEKTIQVSAHRSLSSPESNAQLHVDSFHKILKAYFVIENVDETNAAFRYVRSTNRLTIRKLICAYVDSNTMPLGTQKRLSDKEAAKFGTIEHVCAPSNSLIIADTSGLHARGEFLAPKTRKIIYMDCRYNPFLGLHDILRSPKPKKRKVS